MHGSIITPTGTRRPASFLLLLVLLAQQQLLLVQASFVIEVPNGEAECVSIRVPVKSYISGNYDCLDDDVDGSMIKATVRDENNNKEIKWKSSNESTQEIFRVEVEPSRYSLCFTSEITAEDNEEREEEGAMVGFSLRWIPPPRALPDGEEGPEAKRALQLVDTASLVDNDWQNLLDHYDFLRMREANHRELIEAIFSRLWKWTLIEAFLVIFMAFLQVVYLRKFFEQRRYL